MTTNYLTAIDIETPLITYLNPMPDAVCMSFDNGTDKGVLPASATTLMNLRDYIGAGKSLVGHSISFDLSILCHQYPELWPMVFTAYDEGRIHDTMLRERLLMLTTNGDFNVFYGPYHKNVKIEGYSLVALEKKYLGIDRSDDKKNPDSWRFRYAELKDTPIKC